MTTADPSFSDEILQTVSGTTTAWLPLTTPWVSIAACSSQLYGLFGTATVWYNPPADGKTVYVLGPTFVCPAAYYPAQTLAVNSATDEILCCPTSYTLGPILTHNPRTDFPNQCYSTCTNGQALTYMTQSSPAGPWFPFTRGIQSDPFTVFGVFVNGYNVIATTTSSSTPSSVPASTTPSTSTPTSSTSTTPTPSTGTSSGLSSGAAAGIGVGVAAAIIVLAILAFFLYRWRKRKTNPHTTAYPSEPAYHSGPAYFSEPEMRQEMDARKKDPNYYGGPTHELPTQNSQLAYELR